MSQSAPDLQIAHKNELEIFMGILFHYTHLQNIKGIELYCLQFLKKEFSAPEEIHFIDLHWEQICQDQKNIDYYFKMYHKYNVPSLGFQITNLLINFSLQTYKNISELEEDFLSTLILQQFNISQSQFQEFLMLNLQKLSGELNPNKKTFIFTQVYPYIILQKEKFPKIDEIKNALKKPIQNLNLDFIELNYALEIIHECFEMPNGLTEKYLQIIKDNLPKKDLYQLLVNMVQCAKDGSHFSEYQLNFIEKCNSIFGFSDSQLEQLISDNKLVAC
jgi:hypothetical protein